MNQNCDILRGENMQTIQIKHLIKMGLGYPPHPGIIFDCETVKPLNPCKFNGLMQKILQKY
jgi:hypothetical protein